MNLYAEVVARSLSRLLASYDLDESSPSYGCGDRAFWGWKVTDFANGTLQGGVYTLAAALRLGLFENRSFCLTLIDAAIRAIPLVASPAGALNEAYPGERSYCVTALAAHDALAAVALLASDLKEAQVREYMEIVRPLVKYICEHDETHAIISNHLATAAAAIALWNRLADERLPRAKELIDLIISQQSEEGWYREYEGADPGYQTLCTCYLATYYRETGDQRLAESLIRSAGFLKYFIHPDGTTGGLYGSRNTEVYYPAGVVSLMAISPDFAAMAVKSAQGIAAGRQITPDMIDTCNFAPLLNTYAAAALVAVTDPLAEHVSGSCLPCEEHGCCRDFKDAGIFIKGTSAYYAILNYRKGGTLKVFDRESGMLDCEDGGLRGTLSSGETFSTQVVQPELQFNDSSLRCGFFLHNNMLPSPATFIIIRLLGLTFLRISALGELFKKTIVKLLMTGKRRLDGGVVRTFEFTTEKIVVTEQITPPVGSTITCRGGKFRAIHMASSGYYLKQVGEMPTLPRRVEFK